jgi:hypothetical protein
MVLSAVSYHKEPISADEKIRSKLTRSMFRIFPLKASTACILRLGPCFAVPPAELPSTINNSDNSGTFS